MDKIIQIIEQTCLKHRDSGEASCTKQARMIIGALKEAGYEIKEKIIVRTQPPEPEIELCQCTTMNRGVQKEGKNGTTSYCLTCDKPMW